MACTGCLPGASGFDIKSTLSPKALEPMELSDASERRWLLALQECRAAAKWTHAALTPITAALAGVTPATILLNADRVNPGDMTLYASLALSTLVATFGVLATVELGSALAPDPIRSTNVPSSVAAAANQNPRDFFPRGIESIAELLEKMECAAQSSQDWFEAGLNPNKNQDERLLCREFSNLERQSYNDLARVRDRFYARSEYAWMSERIESSLRYAAFMLLLASIALTISLALLVLNWSPTGA